MLSFKRDLKESLGKLVKLNYSQESDSVKS